MLPCIKLEHGMSRAVILGEQRFLGMVCSFAGPYDSAYCLRHITLCC